MPDISKIRLPGSNIDYNIKDTVAREMISGGVSFNIGWNGESVPDVTSIPEGIKVIYEGQEYTGTLSPAEVSSGSFSLVRSSTNAGIKDSYDEYVVVKPTDDSSTWRWEKIGDTQVDLSDVVIGVTLNKINDVALGEDTTFSNSPSTVSFSGGTTDIVLGADTTFTGVDPAITIIPSTTYIGASTTTGDFVTSVSAETNKNLVTTTVSNITGNASVSIPNVVANTDVSVPNITGNNSVTANKSTWSFSMGSGDAAETLIIGGGNGSDVSATNTILGNTNTASKVTLGNVLTATNTILGTDKTVATGTTSTTGTGDAIVTGVTVGSTAKAVTGVNLASNSSSATGRVQVATGIAEANASGTGIIVGANDRPTVVKTIGTATAAAQNITVGNNDKITVLTDQTSINVTKGNE